MISYLGLENNHNDALQKCFVEGIWPGYLIKTKDVSPSFLIYQQAKLQQKEGSVDFPALYVVEDHMIQDSGCAVEVLYSEKLDSVPLVAVPKLTTPNSGCAVEVL